MSSLGDLLREHRIAAGLSQNELARRALIDPAYINRIEKGAQSSPSRDVILSLGQVLGLGPSLADRLLFVAGLATERDWQAVATDYVRRLRAIDRELVGLDALND